MSRYIRTLKPWPLGTPLPATGLFVFYDPQQDDEFKLLPEQVGGGQQVGPNLRPDSAKNVRFLTKAESAAHFGGETLEGLLGKNLHIGAEAKVQLYTEHDGVGAYELDVRMVVVTGPADSLLRVQRDGSYAFDSGAPDGLVPGKWVRLDSPAAGVPTYDSLPAGYSFKFDELVRDYVPGTDSELFFAALTTGPLPAPSDAAGDANWRRVAEADVPAPSTGGASSFSELAGDPRDNAALAAELATVDQLVAARDARMLVRQPNGAVSVLYALPAFLQEGSTVTVYGTLSFPSLDYQVPAGSTWHLAPGAVLTLKNFRPPNTLAPFVLCGPGTLNSPVNPGPSATNVTIQDVTVNGDIYAYAFAGDPAPRPVRSLKVRNVRLVNTQASTAAITLDYGLTSYYRTYIRAEVTNCLIQSASDAISFFNLNPNDQDAEALATNRLLLSGNLLGVAAGKQVIRAVSQQFVLWYGGNRYQPGTAPASFPGAVLLGSDGEAGGTGLATVNTYAVEAAKRAAVADAIIAQVAQGGQAWLLEPDGDFLGQIIVDNRTDTDRSIITCHQQANPTTGATEFCWYRSVVQ